MIGEVLKSEKFITLSQESIGWQRLLTFVDVKNIIVKTELPLLDEVAEKSFQHWLNDCVEWTIREQLTARLDWGQVKKVSDVLAIYREFSSSFLYTEDPPPPLPRAWAVEAEKWVADARRTLDLRSAGGGRLNAEKWVFYPRAIGLFHAAFGVEPDAVVSKKSKGSRGAVFRFLSATTEIVNARIEERSFSVSVPDDLKALALWHPIPDDRFRKRLKAVLEMKMSLGPEQGCVEYHPITGKMNPQVTGFEGPAWRIFSEEFRDALSDH
ncbi:hypothetical protein [Ruegeria arenilitoris]|uniref:hypothetical protein n=1 Tax=Ruegeria arenilitoris TaxID=1173585 RepID=UPI00147FA7A7|nr:hypothetical protein [Ruegeria arenilitoris]